MPDKQLSLLFGSVNSVPPGMLSRDLEDAYQNYYKPFLSSFYHHETVPLFLYFSGPLFSWLVDAHPEYLMLINEMVKRKQLEILTGAYYDPFLPLVSAVDRLGQIEMLTTLIRKKCGKRPRGIWLSSMVWEPDLASLLNSAGLKYTFLPENNFRSLGLMGEHIYQPWLTEDQGKMMEIIPASPSHASLMLNTRPDHFVHELIKRCGSGLCPVIFERLQFLTKNITAQEDVRKILDDCLDAVSVESSVRLQLPGRYLKDFKQWKKIYLPPTKLTSDTFPVGNVDPSRNHRKKNYNLEKIREKTLFFRQWLEEIQDSSLLYAKTQHVSLLIGQLTTDKARRKAAREELWTSQSHHSYWPESSGGIWDNKIRNAAYKHLIEAETLSRQKGVFIPSIIMTDYDFDGEKEYLYQGKKYNSYICHEGGMVFEHDFLQQPWNLASCVGSETNGLSLLLENAHIPVHYMKKLFCDHFWKKTDDAENFFARAFVSYSGADKRYELEEFDREKVAVGMRLKKIPLGKADKTSGTLKKRFCFAENELNLQYDLISDEKDMTDCVFGTEMNFSLPQDSHNKFELYFLDNKGQKTNAATDKVYKNVMNLVIEDHERCISLALTFDRKPSVLICENVLTVQTVTGIKHYHQGTSILVFWKLAVSREKSFQTALKLKMTKISDLDEDLV